ncbi:MAG TPA: hypothetical protein VEJ86_03070, partial [Candidatus Binataceae bacterium]|nr:hypothetical protein [Candidatus Binataceae bacterium]
VTVDGQPQPTFMVSPSFIGVEVPVGVHQVRAEYRSSTLKKVLLGIGALGLLAMIALRRSFERIEPALLGPSPP